MLLWKGDFNRFTIGALLETSVSKGNADRELALAGHFGRFGTRMRILSDVFVQLVQIIPALFFPHELKNR